MLGLCLFQHPLPCWYDPYLLSVFKDFDRFCLLPINKIGRICLLAVKKMMAVAMMREHV